MSRTIMLIPTDIKVGLTSVSQGLLCALNKKFKKLIFFKPIQQDNYFNEKIKKEFQVIPNAKLEFFPDKSISIKHVKFLLASNQQDILMEKIISYYYEINKNAELILIEGLNITHEYYFTIPLNYAIARMLNAEIVFVMSLGKDIINKLQEHINLIISNFIEEKNNITGIIINKFNAPIDKQGNIQNTLLEVYDKNKPLNIKDQNLLFKNSSLPILGCIPWNNDLITIRAIDIANQLKAKIIYAGEIHTRRVKYISLYTNILTNTTKYLYSESLLIIPHDRPDILMTIYLAMVNKFKISAILLTGSYTINPQIQQLCESNLQTGLPIFIVQTNTWQTCINIQNLNLKTPIDDVLKVTKSQNYIAKYIDNNWIKSLSTKSKISYNVSPQAFKYQLTQLAQQANKCIILPEGDEKRTIKAASICAERGIARCILLGKHDTIFNVAKNQNITLNNNIEIIDPENIRKKYITRLIEIRKNKGMTETLAYEYLKDNVALGTMMLEKGEVDGLVSGTINTTANTIRPSLQLIKTAPGQSLVSSIFFMLLPKKVIIYGDCAINKNPTSEQLAEIAIQSADSAYAFGIHPLIAMISYSTGSSGMGSDVEKVLQATHLVKKKRPDLIIDGPLQYDAAIAEDVAMCKAPKSQVAGKATVFIFPDLNTGNTTYKAVQRSANLISIGPMLQGLRKAVNDLSRGAIVDDIIYTIALTAIQSTQKI